MTSVLGFGALDLGEAPSQLFPEAIGGGLAIGMRGSFGGFEAILVTVKVRHGYGGGPACLSCVCHQSQGTN